MSKKTLNLQISELEQLADNQANVSLMPCPCGSSVPRKPKSRRRQPILVSPGPVICPAIGPPPGYFPDFTWVDDIRRMRESEAYSPEEDGRS